MPQFVLREAGGAILANGSGEALTVLVPITRVRLTATLRTLSSSGASVYALGGSAAVGNLLVLSVGNYPSGIATVTDDKGNTWQRAVFSGDGGDNFIDIWWTQVVTGGALTLTVTPTASSDNYLSGIVQEFNWPGGAGTWALDRTGTSTTGAVSTSSATTTDEQVSVVAAVVDVGTSNAGMTAPTNYTLADLENNSTNYTGYMTASRILSAAAVETASGFNPLATQLDTVIATFKFTPTTGGIQGVAAITLGAITAAATGTSPRNGAASITLGDVLALAAGSVAIRGASAITLGGVVAQGAGSLSAKGVASITLGSVVASATGALPIAGTAGITLGAVGLEAAGSLQATGSGSAAITLGDIIAFATGSIPIKGSAGITLGGIVAQGAGSLAAKAQASITLGSVLVVAEGVVGEPPRMGEAAITLGAIGISSAGVLPLRAAAAIALGDIVAQGAGGLLDRGVADITLGSITASAVGHFTIRGEASITLGSIGLQATGQQGEVILPESEFLRYVVPASGLRYAVPGVGLRYMVPRSGMIYVVPPTLGD